MVINIQSLISFFLPKTYMQLYFKISHDIKQEQSGTAKYTLGLCIMGCLGLMNTSKDKYVDVTSKKFFFSEIYIFLIL